MELRRENICTHVTALKVFANILFVGEGNQVSLFNWKTKALLKKIIVFRASFIHGIKIGNADKALLFGGKSFRVYTLCLSSSECLIEFTEELYINDWIHDVCFLNAKDILEDQVAIISAHNNFTVWDIKEKKQIKNVQCMENCILYTASIFNCNADAIILAVGTVFQKILLWSPNCHNEVKGTKVPFHSLEGHQGVIFSVTFSEIHKLICSTSDDRSLRIWKVQCDSSVKDFSLEFWKKSDIFIVHVLFSHESRVWTSVILRNCILSVGEDSHICFWSLNGRLIKKKRCHKGGSIWCLETTANSVNNIQENDGNLGNYIAFTGGSDGGVYLCAIGTISAALISQASLHTRPSELDFPRATFLLVDDETEYIMSTTDKGWLSQYNIKTKNWKDIFHDKSNASYCVSSISYKSAYIALGNMHGYLFLSKYERAGIDLKKFKVCESKICSIHWVDKKNDHFLTCGIQGYMILWKVQVGDELSIECIQKLHLPKCKPHWWSTTALFLESESCLIVGDKGGNIHIYTLHVACYSNNLENPRMTFSCIHGENGVTDIQEHNSLVYSSGRDARVLVHCISNGCLKLLHCLKGSYDLEWIGKMLFYGDDLLLLGFYTKYFMVWSTQLESAIMTVECGGGHRSWDFHLSSEGKATFVAIKKKDIIFTVEDLHFVLNNSILKMGISGQKFCNICFLFNSKSDSSGNLSVVASGGEDNVLQILGFYNGTSKSSKIVCLHNLSGHLSSIRTIKKTEMKEKNSYLLVSAGGRAQIMLWKIRNDDNLSCEELATFILSFDEKKRKKRCKEKQEIEFDPQTRLMDVSLCCSQSSYEFEKYLIATACSDSYFRVYTFDVNIKELSICYSVQLGEHCIFTLSEIRITEASNDNLLFVTGAADGKIKIMNHKNYIRLCDNQKKMQNLVSKSDQVFHLTLHQSGINAIDLKQITENMWFVCCGGDDNALSAVLVQFNEISGDDPSIEVIAETHICNAHASQITGIKIIGNRAVASISIDQRLNLWSWNFSNNSLNITQELSKLSLIPDISHLECWQIGSTNHFTLVVCGQGVESFHLSNCICF